MLRLDANSLRIHSESQWRIKVWQGTDFMTAIFFTA